MQKIHKSQVIGLPPHAQMQYMAGTPRIYFQYNYRIDGKPYTERDYLGTVDELTLEFVPNAYFMREKPVFENRPIHHYKNEIKRAREIERRNKELLARKEEILKNESARAKAAMEAAGAIEPMAGELEAGKNEVAVNKTGKNEVAVNKTGKNEVAVNKTGKNEVAVNKTGKNEVAVNTTGKNEVELNKNEEANKAGATGSIRPVQNGPGAREGEAKVAAAIDDGLCDGLNNNHGIVDLEEPADVLEPNESRLAGASAVAMAVLLQTGMVEDLYYALNCNIKDTLMLVNLAVHVATTTFPTYNAGPASEKHLFIGGKCPTSPRASEFYRRIGADQGINKRISLARLKRVGRKGLISLDGTKIPCNSKKIAIAVVGKDKKGGFSKQISFSLLAHIPSGQAVGYEFYAGNIPDISLVDYYVAQWTSIGIKDTDVTFVMDRGLFSKETVVKLCENGIKFLVGMKTNIKAAAKIIEDRNYEFYEATSLLDNANYFGVKAPWSLDLKERTVDIDIFVYRNPNEEIAEIRQLKEKLLGFKRSWDEGIYDWNSNLRLLCKNPTEGKKLTIDWNSYNQECYLHGFFALASNLAGLSLETALDTYSTRNEVEVMFKSMFQHLQRTTRVHSLEALGGLLLAVFVALNILGVLRQRIKAKLPESWLCKNQDATIKSRMGLYEMLWKFEGIRLDRTANGKLVLLGNTAKLRDLAEAIGMKGLFDSPVHVARLFSPSYLERLIGAK